MKRPKLDLIPFSPESKKEELSILLNDPVLSNKDITGMENIELKPLELLIGQNSGGELVKAHKDELIHIHMSGISSARKEMCLENLILLNKVANPEIIFYGWEEYDSKFSDLRVTTRDSTQFLNTIENELIRRSKLAHTKGAHISEEPLFVFFINELGNFLIKPSNHVFSNSDRLALLLAGARAMNMLGIFLDYQSSYDSFPTRISRNVPARLFYTQLDNPYTKHMCPPEVDNLGPKDFIFRSSEKEDRLLHVPELTPELREELIKEFNKYPKPFPF